MKTSTRLFAALPPEKTTMPFGGLVVVGTKRDMLFKGERAVEPRVFKRSEINKYH